MKARIITLTIMAAWLPLQGAGSGEEKLDQILAELARMNANMARLEQRVAELEGNLTTAAAESIVATRSAQAESSSPGGESLIERVVSAVHIREQQVNFPWMEKVLWEQLEEGMSKEEVIAILGEPTLEDPSLKRLIDTVFTYRGRKPATGERVAGKVRFYKDRLVNFEAP